MSLWTPGPLDEAAALIRTARTEYYQHVEAALADIKRQSYGLGRAIGDVSVDEALRGLAGYAHERLSTRGERS